MSSQTSPPELIADLPGSEFVYEGLADLESGRESIASLLLEIARTRLSQAGLRLPASPILPNPIDAETRLYRHLMQRQPGDAYSQYNAWIRRLVSLERALESRRERSSTGRLGKEVR